MNIKPRYYNSVLSNWRVDPDGMLRVTARVLAEGVFDYAADESPGEAKLNEKGYVGQYIPKQEFTAEALKTLEGKPVIVDEHKWRTSENTRHDGLSVGAVAGTPTVQGPYIVADLLIDDKAAIEDIKAGKLLEISAAYEGDCYAKNGVFKGEPFGAVQKDLRFNHVLLLPEGAGRCGREVRIVNKRTEEVKGMKVIQRQFGNRRVDFKFTNEEDADRAEEMADEERKFNAAELDAAMAKAAEIKEQMDALKSEYDAAMETISAQKAQIDELMSAETQEALAQEAAAQTEAEEAIVDDAVENEVIEEETKEEIKNKLQNCKTFAERRRYIVQNALKVAASELKEWNQDAIDGAFETLHRNAQIRTRQMNKTVMGGARGKLQNSDNSPLQRILRPMKLQNRRTGKDKE